MLLDTSHPKSAGLVNPLQGLWTNLKTAATCGLLRERFDGLVRHRSAAEWSLRSHLTYTPLASLHPFSLTFEFVSRFRRDHDAKLRDHLMTAVLPKSRYANSRPLHCAALQRTAWHCALALNHIIVQIYRGIYPLASPTYRLDQYCLRSRAW